MRILYQMPSLDTLSAGRTIYYGYKNAFEDLGHEWRALTAEDDLETVLETYRPEIFFTSLSSYYFKFLDMYLLREAKKNTGLRVFANTPPWRSPLLRTRINETPSLATNKDHLALIASGLFDAFYCVSEQWDPAMDGFEKVTGYKYHTVPLAADKIVLREMFDEAWKADISFVGTNLPQKKRFFGEFVFPLARHYNLRIYGQDWTSRDKVLGWIQKGGQYFNLPFLKTIRKPKLTLEDEARIYSSSTISINIHEDYQRRDGAHCNERTFKIPVCGGFEITDDVACIREYFKEGEEMIVARNKADWFEKIEYFVRNPEKRLPVIEAGRKKVLASHTYHNRVEQFMRIYAESNQSI